MPFTMHCVDELNYCSLITVTWENVNFISCDPVSRQWRPWSDCGYTGWSRPSLCAFVRKAHFHMAQHTIISYSDFVQVQHTYIWTLYSSSTHIFGLCTGAAHIYLDFVQEQHTYIWTLYRSSTHIFGLCTGAAHIYLDFIQSKYKTVMMALV